MASKESSTGASKSADEKLLRSLRTFIRAQGAEYLRDPNISSIGIGYKVTDGKPTEEISLQFTVDGKAAPEDLEPLGTAEIPESVVVDGAECTETAIGNVRVTVLLRRFVKMPAEESAFAAKGCFWLPKERARQVSPCRVQRPEVA